MKNKLHLIIVFSLIGSSIINANNENIMHLESFLASTLVIALIIFLASFLASKVVYKLFLKLGGKERKYSWRMSLTCLIILVVYLFVENNYHPFFNLERIQGSHLKEIVHLSTAAVMMLFGCFIGYKLSPVKRLYY